MSGIWVFAEQREKKFKRVVFEILSEAKKIAESKGEELCAVLLGHEIDNLSSELAAYGAEKVFVVEDEILKDYSNESYASVIAELARKYQPSIILGGATAMGKDFLPRVAAKLNTGIASDCVSFFLDEEGRVIFRRPIYAGKALIDVYCDGIPHMATIRPNVLELAEPDSSRKAEIIKCQIPEDAKKIRARIKEIIRGSTTRPDLTEARIIVSGGRAMKSAENFKILYELADVLGAAVGASRAAVDSGYATHDMQVGQTGKTVSPNLYIACGISGAIQHLAGMRTSKCIVAINKDPDAPIFKIADYGIVGDLFKIVPLLKEEFKKVLSEH